MLSSLSPRDRELLDDFALVGFDVESLARRRSLSISAALEWALAPHIAQAADFIRAGLTSLNSLRCQLARERVITSLSKALDAASSPTEICRVANALIRLCLAPASPRQERASSPFAAPQAPPPQTAPPANTPPKPAPLSTLRPTPPSAPKPAQASAPKPALPAPHTPRASPDHPAIPSALAEPCAMPYTLPPVLPPSLPPTLPSTDPTLLADFHNPRARPPRPTRSPARSPAAVLTGAGAATGFT